MDNSEILARIKLQKENWENSVETEKLEIEADIALIRGKKKKGADHLIGSTITSNKIRALVARSYFSKTPINIRPTMVGSERIAKAQNRCYREDRDSPYMKALRYYKDTDKFITGLAILAKTGWDGKRKSPKWDRINPLLAVPDPYGDYFTGDYRYIGFYSVRTKAEMDEMGWDTSWCGDAVWGEKERKQKEQLKNGTQPQEDKELFDIYLHFEREGDNVKLYIVNGNCTHILQEKTLKEMPFAFFYWSPNGSFFGERVAGYTRDTDKWKAEMRNLQAEKVRNEVYTLWLYNSDYVNGKDISFGINKKVPLKTWLDGANVPLSNIIAPAQKDVQVDNTQAFIQSLEQDLVEATSIGAIAQGSTPERREALGTNKLVMDNTDINLSMNEEMDAIWEQQFVELWYSAYRENFTSADKKVIYAGASTWETTIILKKEDFIIEGNLSLEIETSKQKEERQSKEMAWRTQTSPLILQDPNINQSSKNLTLRNLLMASGAEQDQVEAEVPHTAQYLLQISENTVLKSGTLILPNPDDNDDEHLVAMGDIDPNDLEMIAHQQAHILNKIEKSKNQQQPMGNNQMLSGAMSQAMAQASGQVAKQTNSLTQ